MMGRMKHPSKRRADTSESAERKQQGGRRPGGGKALSTEEQIEEIHRRVVVRTTADVQGLTDLLSSRRKLMWSNFLAGLARGVGFFLGVSIVGGVVLGVAALTFDHAFAALGLKDVTLKRAVTSAYEKYVEIQDLIGDAQKNIDKARAQMKTLPPPGSVAPAPDGSAPAPSPAPMPDPAHAPEDGR